MPTCWLRCQNFTLDLWLPATVLVVERGTGVARHRMTMSKRIDSRTARRRVSHGAGMLASLATAIVILSAPSAASAKAGSAQLRELVDWAQVIAVVHVDWIDDADPVRFARAKVLRTLKGAPPRTIWLVASPTWMCDTTHAVPGETALVFLSVTTPEKVPARLKSELVFQILHSGRGRMPIREDRGKQYIDYVNPDVVMPLDLPTTDSPVLASLPENRAAAVRWMFRSMELAVLENRLRRLRLRP